jgi:hypothetical protein
MFVLYGSAGVSRWAGSATAIPSTAHFGIEVEAEIEIAFATVVAVLAAIFTELMVARADGSDTAIVADGIGTDHLAFIAGLVGI